MNDGDALRWIAVAILVAMPAFAFAQEECGRPAGPGSSRLAIRWSAKAT